MQRLVLKVTASEIDAPQEPGNRCSTCPVARAATKATGLTAAVEPGSVYIFHGNQYSGLWRTSRAASRFIQAFDAGLPVKPQTFVLTRESA